MDLSTTSTPSLELILTSLGLTADGLENPAQEGGVRIEFEQNFAVEMQENVHGNGRISSRVCKLGNSLVIQEQQLNKALNILGELQDKIPPHVSLAISTHDNCLRSVLEMPCQAFLNQQEFMLGRFHEFVNFSFAYKQTYITFHN